MTRAVSGTQYAADSNGRPHVPRNSELIRQWEILRAIDAARRGMSINQLAAERGVHPKTVRRDLDALSRAGFPLFDETVNGSPRWKLGSRPFRSLEEAGLGTTEMAALYFGHRLTIAAAGPALANEGERALMKIERALPAASRRFLDELPRVLNAKHTGRKKQDERKVREIATRILDAITRGRCVSARYASRASGRTREYYLEPQRLSYADGGVYLTAWVRKYEQLRTFALERIETLALEDDRFQPRALPAEPFTNSLGVNSGPSTRVVIAFSRNAAAYVAEREWHRSQHLTSRPDGSLVLELDVCIDQPLRRWILGFGCDARVLGPSSLVGEISYLLNQARAVYSSPAEMAS
jgi:predicted DNA-binding transcriptional regulator YafY